jgi:hypothetical protein
MYYEPVVHDHGTNLGMGCTTSFAESPSVKLHKEPPPFKCVDLSMQMEENEAAIGVGVYLLLMHL